MLVEMAVLVKPAKEMPIEWSDANLFQDTRCHGG
jgi:hypothetical protein